MATSRRHVITKPKDPQIVTAAVQARRTVTPHMQRLTLAGTGLAAFEPLGYDQWFRLFLPREGQDGLTLPTKTNALWYAQFLMTPKDRRPWCRNYTVREFRGGDSPELDIDFVLHGDHAGPASDFAAHAPLGTRVGILDQGLIYQPDRPEPWQLLVADESGLPAVAGILASLPADAKATVYLEIPTAEDTQPLTAPEGVTVHWLPRNDADRKPGELALATVRDAELPDGQPYAFVAGEQALAAGLRRHLVNDRGVPKSHVTFTGYWRHGKAAPG